MRAKGMGIKFKRLKGCKGSPGVHMRNDTGCGTGQTIDRSCRGQQQQTIISWARTTAVTSHWLLLVTVYTSRIFTEFC